MSILSQGTDRPSLVCFVSFTEIVVMSKQDKLKAHREELKQMKMKYGLKVRQIS